MSRSDITVRAPLRVSFFGGGTDSPEFVERYGPGLVLGSAIDLSVTYDGLRFTHPVPLGTGLGSSSAAWVCRLGRVSIRFDPNLDRTELALQSWEVERSEGSSTGWQDAMFAAWGGFNLIEFTKSGPVVTPVETKRLEELQAHLLLVQTSVIRRTDLAKQQLAKIGERGEQLLVARRLAETGYKAITGTVSMKSFGAMLHGAWQVKKSFGVSTPSLDLIYDLFIQEGAWGGKLLGAGGGGFFLFVVPPAERKRIVDSPSLKLLCKEVPFHLNAPGFSNLDDPLRT